MSVELAYNILATRIWKWELACWPYWMPCRRLTAGENWQKQVVVLRPSELENREIAARLLTEGKAFGQLTLEFDS